MKRYLAGFLIILTFVCLEAQEKYSTEEAANHMGENAIVTGFVTQVSTPRNGITYLNIDAKYPDNKFTGVIFKRDIESFDKSPLAGVDVLKELEGKKVELSGKIEEYRGKPQIILKKPDQIKIVTE